jgi:hypothetical protein
MEMVDIEVNYGSQLESLFEMINSTESPFDRGFAMPKAIIKNAIIFIGLNPSFKEAFRETRQGFYEIGQGVSPGYFSPFGMIAEQTRTTWSHLDLLSVRETNQKIVERLQYTHLDFVVKNLQISKLILEESTPKLIVVCNSLSRRYIGKEQKNGEQVWMGYNFGAMQEDGTYRIQNPDSKLQGVPVFFSGMLSGQRALDIGSRERLVWHIKKVLQNG